MSPDPSHRTEERRLSNEGTYVTGAIINSENEDDDISYEGYEMLPQDFNESNVEPVDDADGQDSSSEDDIVITDCTYNKSVEIERTELWNSSYDNRTTDIAMDSTKEEVIKNAMANFKLPSTSIPLWAKDIPEEEWKEYILNRINSSSKT